MTAVAGKFDRKAAAGPLVAALHPETG